MNQSSIKAKKTKSGAGPAPVGGKGFGSKFDPDIQDVASDEDQESTDEEDSS